MTEMSAVVRSELFRRGYMYAQLYRPCRSTALAVVLGVPFRLKFRSSIRLNCLKMRAGPAMASASGVGLPLTVAVPRIPSGNHGAVPDAGTEVSGTYNVRRGMRQTR